MLRIGCCSGAFPDLSLQTLLPWLADLDYAGVQLDPCHVQAGIDADERQRVAMALRASGLEEFVLRTDVQLPPEPPGGELTDTLAYKVAVRDQEAQLRRTVELAAELGVATVAFAPGCPYFRASLPPPPPYERSTWHWNGDEAIWHLFSEAVAAVARDAERLGITLAVENHGGRILEAPERMALFLDMLGSPVVRTLVDAGDYHVLNINLSRAVKRLVPRIAHCRLPGVMGKYPYYDFVIPGGMEDELACDEFFEALEMGGFSGLLLLETFPWHGAEAAGHASRTVRARLPAGHDRG